MGRADAILARVNTVMRKVAPLERTVYKRTITRTGGNSLIGRPGAVVVSDVLFDPQPVATMIGRESVSGGHTTVEHILQGSGSQGTADEYRILFSANAYSRTELANKDILIVLKDASGNEEVLIILDVEPIGMNGTDIVYTVYARSTKRQ
jgi:hypothetical protein